jgi:hypothetical protein
VYALLHERLGVPLDARSVQFSNTIKRRRSRHLRAHGKSEDTSKEASGRQDRIDRLTPVKGNGRHMAAVSEHWPSSTASEDGLGDVVGEVTVGISWIVGAVVQELMTQHQQGMAFWRRSSPSGGSPGHPIHMRALLILLPLVVVLALVVYLLSQYRPAMPSSGHYNSMQGSGGSYSYSSSASSSPAHRTLHVAPSASSLNSLAASAGAAARGS